MKARGMSMADLAKATGLSVPTIRLQVTYARYPRRAYKIEKALNAPIWTDIDRFNDLRRASVLLGVDFILTKFHPLRSAAVAKGVRHTRSVTHKDALLTLVLAHLAKLETQPTK